MSAAVQTILAEVASANGRTVPEILSDRRTAELVGLRHAAVFLTARLTTATLEQIGHAMRRDRTTIRSWLDAAEERIRTEVGYGDALEVLEAVVRPKLARLVPGVSADGVGTVDIAALLRTVSDLSRRIESIERDLADMVRDRRDASFRRQVERMGG